MKTSIRILALALVVLMSMAVAAIKYVAEYAEYLEEDMLLEMAQALLKLKQVNPAETIPFIIQTPGLKDLLTELAQNAELEVLKATITTLLS